MHELNSLKVTAACLSNLCVVTTFTFSGAIIWHYCVISMALAGVGGYVGGAVCAADECECAANDCGGDRGGGCSVFLLERNG